KIQPARTRRIADKAEHLQVALSLAIRQFGDTDVIAGYRDEERVGEVKIGVRYLAKEIVGHPKHQAEAIETLRGEHREVRFPQLPIVEPGLVLDFAGDDTSHGPDRIGR